MNVLNNIFNNSIYSTIFSIFVIFICDYIDSKITEKQKTKKEYFKRAIIVGVLVFFISNNIKGNDIFSNINNNLIGGRISNIDITPGPPDF
tara:strand:- start:2332 stop:2604 length:273 start_codon:yes stop_codon:yes gene_type:complete